MVYFEQRQVGIHLSETRDFLLPKIFNLFLLIGLDILSYPYQYLVGFISNEFKLKNGGTLLKIISTILAKPSKSGYTPNNQVSTLSFYFSDFILKH